MFETDNEYEWDTKTDSWKNQWAKREIFLEALKTKQESNKLLIKKESKLKVNIHKDYKKHINWVENKRIFNIKLISCVK